MKCFVISPIGQPGSAVREHADDVFDCIIGPAFQETGVEGRRADHVLEVGRITKQMYDEILNADFCVALLHGFNPNVFYEMAVAHSAGIPVILLSEKGFEPPFDVRDERVFHYDLSPRQIYNGSNIRRLVAMIESVHRLGGRREVPFGANLSPLNASAASLPYSLVHETGASAEFWLGLVRGVRHRLFLMGRRFTGWKGMPGMRDAIGAVAASEADVRVLTMDPDNAAVASQMNPDVIASGEASLRGGLAETLGWFRASLGSNAATRVRGLRSGMIYQQIVVADDQALVSPYLYSASTAHSPCLVISAASPAFAAYLHEFEEQWTAAG